VRQKNQSLDRILSNFHSLAQKQHLLPFAPAGLYSGFKEAMVSLGLLSPHYMSSLLKPWHIIAMSGPS